MPREPSSFKIQTTHVNVFSSNYYIFMYSKIIRNNSGYILYILYIFFISLDSAFLLADIIKRILTSGCTLSISHNNLHFISSFPSNSRLRISSCLASKMNRSPFSNNSIIRCFIVQNIWCFNYT